MQCGSAIPSTVAPAASAACATSSRFPSASPDTGRRDRDVLRELLERRGSVDGEPCLGVYAEVLEPGVVRVGDAVVPA